MMLIARILSGIRSTHNYPKFSFLTYWNRGGREFIIRITHVALIILITRRLIAEILIGNLLLRGLVGIRVYILCVCIFMVLCYFLLPIWYHITFRDRKVIFLERALETSRICTDKYTFWKRIPDYRDWFLPKEQCGDMMKWNAVSFCRGGIKRAWERGLKWHLCHRFVRASGTLIYLFIIFFV